MGRISKGHTFGYQKRGGTPLGDQFPSEFSLRHDPANAPKAFHGAPVAGIDEVKPGREVGWVNHEVSHPDKVYAAVGESGEKEAWGQATLAGSKKLGEHVEEHGTLPSPEESPTPTVYDVTMRGNVDTDPEYEKHSWSGAQAIRADRASVNREISMPVGAQGTLLPDYFGRTESFAEGFRGGLLSETTREMVTGQKFEFMDPGPDPVVEAHVAPGNARRRLEVQPAQQMTAASLDRQGIANFPVEDEPLSPAREMGEHPSPQLFNPATDAIEIASNFPYGRSTGWESRRQAFSGRTPRW